MKAVATKIRASLLADTTVNNLVVGRVYWGLGKQNETESAVVFSLQEIIAGATRDTRKFSTVLRCYAKDMELVSDVYEAVKLVMIAEGHNFQGGQSGISDEEEGEAVMEMIFNLN